MTGSFDPWATAMDSNSVMPLSNFWKGRTRRLCVPPRTEMRAVPMKLGEDEQFVVAYRAQSEANEISRTSPIKVDGHKRVRLIERRKDPDSPNVLIQYRGGRSESDSDRDDRSNSLYLPDTEVAAKHILREANYTSQNIVTPLTKQDYTETAEQVDARESSALSGLNSKSTPRSP